MLAAAHPDVALEELAQLSLGQRNKKLFRFRDTLFGTEIEANSSCPECTEKVEFYLDSTVICSPERPTWDGKPILIEVGESQVLCNAPNSRDLEAILPFIQMEDHEAAAMELMQSCVVQYKEADVYVPVHNMPAALIENVSERIKEVDAHSEINCRLECPQCSHSWAEPFDIVSFLWQELEVKAQIILGEVQLLAKAFGWWEGDILSLSDVRRKHYIEALHE